MSGPLTGYKVIELAGIGPAPYAGQLLSDLGAEVICVERPPVNNIASTALKSIDKRGKHSIGLNLRAKGASDVVLKLVESADILIEGNRPGVTERLGVGPQDCHKVNPKLIYGRMTGWGQNGPWAKMAGHDINYISITGALHAMGKDGEPPMPPLNLVGDYGAGSMVLVMGILSALLQVQKSGKGDVVDAAILDGTSSLMGIFYTLSGSNIWTTQRESNLLDGGRPYYRCYATSDDKFMAVGCLEPQFFKLMLDTLQLDPEAYGHQHDASKYAAQHALLETTFASKTRDEWASIFFGLDACVTPVLDYEEAVKHPQNVARGGLKTHKALIHPRTIPIFESRDAEPDFNIPDTGADTLDILRGAGFSAEHISDLIGNEVVYLKQ